ncbi:hypothetical protein [Tenacibaculum soleae]|uniref:hypothetical protein n=1 Tax=Tenacibaculum soleae TaxID=447689 RepID=UPI0026E38CAC|nr:hypothetical protein [Tenacibaculum soleae]MDO6813812.1 hypothetical protein [Tenacibaculum soleae]
MAKKNNNVDTSAADKAAEVKASEEAKVLADKEAAELNASEEDKALAGAPVLNATQLRQQEANKLRAANKSASDKKAKAIEDKKADEAAIAETSAKNPEKDTRKVFKDDRGQRFRFKKSAPSTLNIDGVSTSINEIIEDEEIMLELVNGNSNYLEQIH